MLIGANVSMKGSEMLLGAVEEAASYTANTLQFYTGAPQNTRRKPTSEMMIPEGLAAMTKDGISHTVIHAPYIVKSRQYQEIGKLYICGAVHARRSRSSRCSSCLYHAFSSRCACRCWSGSSD